MWRHKVSVNYGKNRSRSPSVEMEDARANTHTNTNTEHVDDKKKPLFPFLRKESEQQIGWKNKQM
jgi:hypothetical protein